MVVTLASRLVFHFSIVLFIYVEGVWISGDRFVFNEIILNMTYLLCFYYIYLHILLDEEIISRIKVYILKICNIIRLKEYL